jgi:Ras family protein T1
VSVHPRFSHTEPNPRGLASPEDKTHLESEIRKAHVICVVYGIDNPNSFDRIPTYWLPLFRQLGVNVRWFTFDCSTIPSRRLKVPVVLVGNKIDLRGGEVTNEALEDEIVPIMNEFKVDSFQSQPYRFIKRRQEVEACVECSAKLPVNVSEVFYFAQKAVLHPTAPLYDSRDHVRHTIKIKKRKLNTPIGLEARV